MTATPSCHQARLLFWSLLLILSSTSLSTQAAEKIATIKFHRTRVDGIFRSEGVAAGDFNRDGRLDIAAGSVYFAAPDWKLHAFRDPAPEFDPHVYSESFCDFAEDLNGDGWTDILVVDFPGKETWCYENPQGAPGAWKRHALTPITNNESPDYLDVDGDGKRELLLGAADRMAYLTRSADGLSPWTIHAVSGPKAPGTDRFSHGLGLGDLNGDGRRDILIVDGWWEAPADRSQAEWTFHAVKFGGPCAHMVTDDYDGDGDADVINSSAHGIGVWWHEQTPDGWKTHEIDTSFSQTHSLCQADINGDGLNDFVTGKRWWAHGPSGDVMSDQPAVLYWFELRREGGTPQWIRHQIDHDSGIGTQFQVVDMNGDGLLDVISSNKKGTHYFEQYRE